MKIFKGYGKILSFRYASASGWCFHQPEAEVVGENTDHRLKVDLELV
jgi:hypothetical protein